MSLLNIGSRDNLSQRSIGSTENDIQEQAVLSKKSSSTSPAVRRPRAIAEISSNASLASSTSNTSLASSSEIQANAPVQAESPLSKDLNKHASTLANALNISGDGIKAMPENSPKNNATEPQKNVTPPHNRQENTKPIYVQRVGNKFEKMLRRIAEMPLSVLASGVALLPIPLFLGVSTAFLIASPFMAIGGDFNVFNKSMYFFAQALFQLHLSITFAIKTVVAPLESVVTLTTTALGMGDILKRTRRHATRMFAHPMFVLKGLTTSERCTSCTALQDLMNLTREKIASAGKSTIMNENKKNRFAHKLIKLCTLLPIIIGNAFARTYVKAENFKKLNTLSSEQNDGVLEAFNKLKTGDSTENSSLIQTIRNGSDFFTDVETIKDTVDALRILEKIKIITDQGSVTPKTNKEINTLIYKLNNIKAREHTDATTSKIKKIQSIKHLIPDNLGSLEKEEFSKAIEATIISIESKMKNNTGILSDFRNVSNATKKDYRTSGVFRSIEKAGVFFANDTSINTKKNQLKILQEKNQNTNLDPAALDEINKLKLEIENAEKELDKPLGDETQQISPIALFLYKLLPEG